MRILHSYCLNYNLGDYALGIGLKNLLRSFLPVDFIGNTNIQGREFNEYYINEVVNKRYDFLVLGGGGLIHGSHWPNGWFWLIKQELIKQIKIPFIVYGIGDNYFEKDEIPVRAIRHLTETYKNSRFFSVRNDGSLERVNSVLPFIPYEVPDPGFYTNYNAIGSYERIINGEYVIVQLANDKPQDRYKTDNVKSHFISELRKVVTFLSKKYKVILLPHVFEDITLSKIVIDGIDNCMLVDFSKLAFDHAHLLMSYYKYAKFVLAMRGHGQIIPISFNVPTIALCNHPKHKGLMNKLSLSEYIVNIDEAYFSTLALNKVLNIENNYNDIVAKLKVKNKEMESQTIKAFELIKQSL